MTKPLRLLLIDDDELDREDIIRAIKGSDLSLDIVQSSTAEDGIRLASTGNFNAILLDYRLPDMDGIEVLKTLRSGQFQGVAVIILSRQEDPLIAERCMEAGAQDFLLKDEVNARRLTRAITLARQRYLMEEALKVSHEKFRILSERDPLTGLTNRRGLEVALNSAVSNANRGYGGLALLLLDLDEFKQVNDTLGHKAGDEVLIEVARRMRHCVRDGDLLCRQGGDEFVVLMINLERGEQAALVAHRLTKTFQEPIKVQYKEVIVTCSIGVAVKDESTATSTDLLKNADIAMYRAKQNGRNQFRFFSEKLHTAVQHIADTKRELLKALQKKEFVIYYQAQMNAADRSLCGLEVLLRWKHPRLGLLTPDNFISISEDTGFIIDIGNWILHESCRQLKNWQSRFPQRTKNLTMSINLSAMQLIQGSLAHEVEIALSEHQIASHLLEFEIRENMVINNQKEVTDTLAELASQNVTLTLGAFGTGYSSLQFLKLIPVNKLKVDKEFISAIGKSTENDRLLVALFRFAQALNLKVIADGVKTREQADFCGLNECNSLQGEYCSTPVPAEEFEANFLAEPALVN